MSPSWRTRPTSHSRADGISARRRPDRCETHIVSGVAPSDCFGIICLFLLKPPDFRQWLTAFIAQTL